MKLSKHHDNAMEKLCRAAIDQRLGDISGLPKVLVAHVRIVYREFISGYLNMLRQREKKPADWMPVTLSIDNELANGMRHFFSDYQHIARAFYALNHKIERLQQIDEVHQPNLYRHAIDDTLKHSLRQGFPGGEHEYPR